MARQSTLNVSLTPALRKYVAAKVKSGTYESASEVIRDSLRALQERENAADEAYWHTVRDKVAVARRQLAQGQGLDGETVMAEIIAEASGDGDEDRDGTRSRSRRGGARGTSKRARR